MISFRLVLACCCCCACNESSTVLWTQRVSHVLGKAEEKYVTGTTSLAVFPTAVLVALGLSSKELNTKILKVP